MKIKHKRFLLQLMLNVAASIFIGIAVYGLIIYWGEPKQISPALSVSLGFVALFCVFLICYLGTRLDKINGEIFRNAPSGDQKP